MDQVQFEARMKTDFRAFVIYLWNSLGLPAPTPNQLDICNYLQHGPSRSIIEAFRGIGKSWLTAAFVVWCLWNNPQLRFLIVSASKERADSFSIFVKRLLGEIPFLQHLLPGANQRDSNVAFEVGPAKPHQAPSVKSVGITGQITGSRAHIVIADDVETPKNSATQLQRDKLSELVKEFDAVLIPGGRILYLGTPQCEMSIYNSLRHRGYETRIWPAEYPTPNLLDMPTYGPLLAPRLMAAVTNSPELAGHSTEPTRFNNDDLASRKLSYGLAGYMLQFMLNTTLSDMERFPLRTADIPLMDLDPEKHPVKIVWARDVSLLYNDVPCVGLAGDHWYKPLHISPDWYDYTGAIMAIDPAGRGADEIGYAVVARGGGYLFLLASGGLKGGYDDDNLRTLAEIAKTFKVNNIIIEANFGDGMFTKIFQPVLAKVYHCGIEEVRHSKQKELRIIDTLEPVLNQHRLIVSRGVVEQDIKAERDNQLFYQMTRITKDRGALGHDDRLDALAMAVAYWVDSLAKGAEQAVDEMREEALEAALNDFVASCFGNRQARHKSSWLSSYSGHRPS